MSTPQINQAPTGRFHSTLPAGLFLLKNSIDWRLEGRGHLQCYLGPSCCSFYSHFQVFFLCCCQSQLPGRGCKQAPELLQLALFQLRYLHVRMSQL